MGLGMTLKGREGGGRGLGGEMTAFALAGLWTTLTGRGGGGGDSTASICWVVMLRTTSSFDDLPAFLILVCAELAFKCGGPPKSVWLSANMQRAHGCPQVEGGASPMITGSSDAINDAMIMSAKLNSNQPQVETDLAIWI